VPVEWADHAEGRSLAVRVRPGAKRSELLGEHAGGIKVAIAAPPVDGKANDALVEFLREIWGLRRGQVEIIRGQSSRDKVVLLRGLTDEQLNRIAGG
jgi:uncharacterized protein (TIGR00251 family)